MKVMGAIGQVATNTWRRPRLGDSTYKEFMMEVPRNPTRLSRLLAAFCLGVGTVGLLSLLVNGQTGLAWGLGWGISTVLVSAGVGQLMLGDTRWGLVLGLSAGMSIGVGLGNLTLALGPLPGLFLPRLFWGVLGGIVASYMVRSVRRTAFGFLLVVHFAGALASGLVGTLGVGLIGEILPGFSLSGAGFLIGVVFMGPCWALSSTAGLIVGHFIFSGRAGESEAQLHR